MTDLVTEGYICMVPHSTKDHLVTRIKHTAGAPLDSQPIYHHRSLASCTFKHSYSTSLTLFTPRVKVQSIIHSSLARTIEKGQ